MFKHLFSALCCAAWASSVMADEVHVTIYNQDLALVRQVREADLASGTTEFSFIGVPSRIDPTSVRLTSSRGGAISILEQNYRYDLVSREKLLERYLDQTARIVTKHDKVHEGTLKTATGSIVLETADGVVLLNNDEIADITLPEIPEGLITRPTLVWLLDASGTGKRNLELAYLTGGLSWHAEYVAAVDSRDESMKLSGWVSIDNQSGASFENASLKVVAGDVHRANQPHPRMELMMDASRSMKSGGGFEERAFFEYHLYDLGRETNLADREVKQIQLLADRDVPIEKIYVYEPTRGNTKVQVKVEFDNAEKNGLGVPIPAGKFRVYREDSDGALEFAGEDWVDHTPRNEEISVALGNAFDLVGEREELDAKRIADRMWERTVRIKLRNQKEKGAVRIQVLEHPGGDWEILESSHDWEKPNKNDLKFEVPVAAGKEVELRYRVRVRM